MNVKQLFADEDAVSPVIGVILMVAITVILAAVIGTFVLGLGENVQDSAPQANFQFEYAGDFTDDVGDGDSITVTHTGGEDVDASTVSFQVADESSTDPSTAGGQIDSANTSASTISTGSSWVGSENVSGATADGSNVIYQDGDDVRVVWTSPSGGTSNTIGSSEVPS